MANKKFNKQYKYLGIALLILSAFELIFGVGKFLLALFFVPDFYFYLSSVVLPTTIEIVVFYITFGLSTLISIWGLALSITLIRKNKYNPQLLYLIYSWIGLNLITFLLDFIIKTIAIDSLISALLIYFILIHFNNSLSRLVKGKINKIN